MPKIVFTVSPGSKKRAAGLELVRLLALTALAIGFALTGCGLALFLLAPLLISAGAALVIFALLVLALFALGCFLRWLVARILARVRQTTFARALSPAFQVLLASLARRLVAFLLAWLDQQTAQKAPHRKPGRAPRRRSRRLLLALTVP